MEFNATFLATIISFLVFVFLMNKILYEPMGRIVAERKTFIDGNLSTADINHKKAEAISKDKEVKLKGARDDARGLYTKSIDDFKAQKNEILNNAQNEANGELNQAYSNLNNVSNETKEALKGRMTDLANDIVEKMIDYRGEVQGFDNDTVNRILYQ